MSYALAYVQKGLGSAQTTGIIASSVATGGSITASALVAAGAVGGPVGVVIGGVAAGISLLISTLFRPNLQKIQASNDANQIEQILKQNLQNWLTLQPSQKTVSVQQAALQVFDSGWAQYEALIQQIPDWQHKAPHSISDRAQGSCAYHTAQPAGWNGTTYVPNGPNQNSGYCWNWFIGYRDPIANDPNIIPDSILGPTSSSGLDLSSMASSSNIIPVLLGVGLVIFGVTQL